MPLLIIYETAVGTLIGTHIGPKNTLTCGLDERWQWLFSQKQGDAIRTIQDAFECCGLHSPVDRAWPFPGHDAGVDACQVRYGRQRSCFEQWRVEEQRIAGWMLVAVVLVVLWMVCLDCLMKERPFTDVGNRFWWCCGRTEIHPGSPGMRAMMRVTTRALAIPLAVEEVAEVVRHGTLQNPEVGIPALDSWV